MATEKDSWADFGGATNSASDGAWADFASFGTSNASAFGTSDAFSQSTPAFPAFDSNTTASTDSAFSVGHQPASELSQEEEWSNHESATQVSVQADNDLFGSTNPPVSEASKALEAESAGNLPVKKPETETPSEMRSPPRRSSLIVTPEPNFDDSDSDANEDDDDDEYFKLRPLDVSAPTTEIQIDASYKPDDIDESEEPQNTTQIHEQPSISSDLPTPTQQPIATSAISDFADFSASTQSEHDFADFPQASTASGGDVDHLSGFDSATQPSETASSHSLFDDSSAKDVDTPQRSTTPSTELSANVSNMSVQGSTRSESIDVDGLSFNSPTKRDLFSQFPTSPSPTPSVDFASFPDSTTPSIDAEPRASLFDTITPPPTITRETTPVVSDVAFEPTAPTATEATDAIIISSQASSTETPSAEAPQVIESSNATFATFEHTSQPEDALEDIPAHIEDAPAKIVTYPTHDMDSQETNATTVPETESKTHESAHSTPLATNHTETSSDADFATFDSHQTSTAQEHHDFANFDSTKPAVSVDNDFAAFSEQAPHADGSDFADFDAGLVQTTSPEENATKMDIKEDGADFADFGTTAKPHSVEPSDSGASDFADWTTSTNGNDGDFADFDSFETGNNQDNFDFGDFPDSAPAAPAPKAAAPAAAPAPAVPPNASSPGNPSVFRGTPSEVADKVGKVLKELNVLSVDIHSASSDDSAMNHIASLDTLVGGETKAYKWEAKDAKKAPKPQFRGTSFENNFLAAIGKQPLPTMAPSLFSLSKRPGSAKKSDSSLFAMAAQPVPLKDSGALAAALGISPVVPASQTPSPLSLTPMSLTPVPTTPNTKTGAATQANLVTPTEAVVLPSSPAKPVDLPLAPMDLSIFGGGQALPPSTPTKSTAEPKVAQEDWLSAFLKPTPATPLDTAPVKPLPELTDPETPSKAFLNLPDTKVAAMGTTSDKPKTMTPSASETKVAVTLAPPLATSNEVSNDAMPVFEEGDTVGPIVWELMRSMPNLAFMNSKTIDSASRH